MSVGGWVGQPKSRNGQFTPPPPPGRTLRHSVGAVGCPEPEPTTGNVRGRRHANPETAGHAKPNPPPPKYHWSAFKESFLPRCLFVYVSQRWLPLRTWEEGGRSPSKVPIQRTALMGAQALVVSGSAT